MKVNSLKLLLFLIVAVTATSCGSVKHSDMVMFPQVTSEITGIDTIPALTIRTDDILSIQVASRNPETVIAFQQTRERSSGVGVSALDMQEGYRVDEEGNIYLPFLGKVKVIGKTVIQAREEITKRLLPFIPDAAVQVRFINFRVTVLGEVFRPNTYAIPNERLTVLEAIGMAGDFTPYARRNDVLVIRERNEVREFARINTNDIGLFKSPYFYLSPNDIVYVEPLKAKQYATQGDFLQRYAGLLFPIVTLLTFVLGTTINR